MSLPSPNLDDRDWRQLMASARRRVQQQCPKWKDLSPGDPGTVLVELFAHLVERLAALPEGEGTVLDHTLALYGSAISDGNRHNHDELPLVLVGGGGGVAGGRHLRFAPETPCANLFVSLLALAGVPRAAFGDSTGALAGLGS